MWLKNKIMYVLLPVIILVTGCNNQYTTENKQPSDLSDLYPKLGQPQPGAWLYEHNEQGQTLAEFKKQTPISSAYTNGKLYLLPLGAVNSDLISALQDYLHAVFNTEVILLPEYDILKIPDSVTRNGQIKTTYILQNILQPIIPADAISLMAITVSDLYPDENWNFVFGEADIQNRVGVSSFARYGDYGLNDSINKLVLSRLLKTTTHEILHALGMQHCIGYVCVLNGSNSLPESDNKPLIICPACLEKLAFILPEANNGYFERTLNFYQQYHFENEMLFCEKALEVGL